MSSQTAETASMELPADLVGDASCLMTSWEYLGVAATAIVRGTHWLLVQACLGTSLLGHVGFELLQHRTSVLFWSVLSRYCQQQLEAAEKKLRKPRKTRKFK